MDHSEAQQWLQQADLLNRRRLALEAECRESLQKVDEQLAAPGASGGNHNSACILPADCSAILVDAALLDSERNESCAQLFSWIHRIRARPVPSKTLDLAKALTQEQASLAAVANVLANVETEAKRILALSDISTSQKAIQEGPRSGKNIPRTVPGSLPRTNSNTAPVTTPSTTTTAADRHADFLTAHGGSSLGWPDDDHMTFLRCIMHRTEREPMALFDDLQEALPHVDAASIGRHLSLYHQHLQLVEEKRKEIALFRLEKEAARDEQGELASIRRDAALQREHLDALKKERRRLEHQQKLHEKLDAWRAKQSAAPSSSPKIAAVTSSVHQGCQRTAPLKPTTANRPSPAAQTAALKVSNDPPPASSRISSRRAASSGAHRAAPPDAAHAPQSKSSDRPQTVKSLSLQRRWEEDRRRVVERAGKVDCKRALAATSRSDALHSLAEHTVSAAVSSHVPSDRQRATRLTESATHRRCSSASDGPRERYHGGVVARDSFGAWYLTPRNSNGTHLASAAWCPKTYQR